MKFLKGLKHNKVILNEGLIICLKKYKYNLKHLPNYLQNKVPTKFLHYENLKKPCCMYQ